MKGSPPSTDKKKMDEYFFDPQSRSLSWHGKFQIENIFAFEGYTWEVCPVLASLYLVNDLVRLAVRGVQSGDEKCVNEVNEFLSTTPEHLREYVNDAIKEAKVHIASDRRMPDPFKKAVVQLEALSYES